MIKKIRMENFRCFNDLGIEFKPGINLLVGDNASGKTTVLLACKYVLSTFFAGFNDGDKNTKWIKPTTCDYRKSYHGGIEAPYQVIKLNALINLNGDDVPIDYRKWPHDSKATIELRRFKKITTLLSYSYFTEHSGQCSPLPLLANYTTKDIHSSRRISPSKFTNHSPKPSIGYYECLDGDGFYKYWKNRILSLLERQKNLDEIDTVKNTVLNALGKTGCGFLNYIETSVIKKKIYYIFSDNRESEDEVLPDGYKRLINIVTDIAFRCVLLNRGIYGKDACAKTTGCVLIDEIDLHLHPSLQSKILTSLRTAFPQIQFIATSHAPMVMTSVESNDENIVYQLSYDKELNKYSANEIDTYGMDSSLILSARLDIDERNSKTKNQLDRLNQLIDNDNITEAKKLLEKLQEQYGTKIPELAGAETEIFIAEDRDALDS